MKIVFEKDIMTIYYNTEYPATYKHEGNTIGLECEMIYYRFHDLVFSGLIMTKNGWHFDMYQNENLVSRCEQLLNLVSNAVDEYVTDNLLEEIWERGIKYE